MLICNAIMCHVYESFSTRLHATEEIDTSLKVLETAHLSAVSKSRDYFSRKQKELYQQNGTFISRHHYHAMLC